MELEKKRKDRWGAKCLVLTCGVKKRDSPNTRFFQFPRKETKQFQLWLDASGLENPPSSQRSFICEKHFKSECFGKKYLKRNVVPTIDICCPPQEQDIEMNEDESTTINVFSGKTYKGPKSRKLEADLTFEEFEKLDPTLCSKNDLENDIFMPNCSSCLKNEKSKHFYIQKYLKLLRSFKKLKAKFENASEKNRKRKSLLLKRTSEKRVASKENKKPLIEIINSVENVSPSAKTLAIMLLCKSCKSKQWDEESRNMALSIHFKSPSTYNYLRKLGLNLPSVSSIYRWLPIKDLQPGFNSDVTQSLKSLIQNWQIDQKSAVLIFDEISIKQDLTYNQVKDEIVGFEDLGGPRENKIAKQVCVFMLRSLYSNWKLIISYYATEKGIRGEKLAGLVQDNLHYCTDLGFEIFAIICDQGSNNRKCFRKLNISIERPYFIFNNKPIFAIYDVPHLFKSIRNLLLKTNILTSDGEISWSVVVALFLLESRQGTKMSCKLNSKHVYPNTWQKMNVALATQVMSRKTVAAIETACALNLFSKKCAGIAKSTAAFFKKMDTAFDCLNSKSPVCENPYKRGLRKDGIVREHLTEMLSYLSNVKYKTPSKNFCVNGLIHSIRSILSLSEHIFSNYPDKNFILTNKLNQDPIENLFSTIRSRGGNSNNPSLDNFNKSVGRIMSHKIITYSAEGSNCEEDPEELQVLDIAVDTENKNFLQENDKNDELNNYLDVENKVTETLKTIDEKFLKRTMLNEDASLRYFIGFVANSYFKKHKCDSCFKEIIKENDNVMLPKKSELLLYYKNYSSNSNFGSLYAPTDLFFDISKVFLNVFKVIFNECPHIKNIKHNIIKKCIEHVDNIEKYSCWFSLENPCRQHHIELLDFFILVLLRKHSQWASKELPNKTNRKIKILTNKYVINSKSKKIKKRTGKNIINSTIY